MAATITGNIMVLVCSGIKDVSLSEGYLTGETARFFRPEMWFHSRAKDGRHLFRICYRAL